MTTLRVVSLEKSHLLSYRLPRYLLVANSFLSCPRAVNELQRCAFQSDLKFVKGMSCEKTKYLLTLSHRFSLYASILPKDVIFYKKNQNFDLNH